MISAIMYLSNFSLVVSQVVKPQHAPSNMNWKPVKRKQIIGAFQLLGIMAVATSFVVGLWAFAEHQSAIWITAIVGFSLLEVGRRMKEKDEKEAREKSRLD